MLEIDDIAEVIASAVKEATAPLLTRIADLEQRELLLPEKGDPGEVDMEEVERLLDEKVAAAVALIPPAEKGEPGEVDMAEVERLVAKAVEALPAPQDGKDCDMAEVAAMVTEATEKAVQALPKAKDGAGLADALIGQDGSLVLVMTDGRTKDLGRVVGKNGEDGAPGLGLEALQVNRIGERRIEFALTRGEEEFAFELDFPVPIYRGVWKAGEYQPGDLVTWGGSLWHCDKVTDGKPGPDGWTLAAKRGRDGKDAAK